MICLSLALIHAANANPNPAIITTLLEAGADINARDMAGWSPLMYAAVNPRAGVMITALLNAGADARVRDSLGRSALDIAQRNHLLNADPAVQLLERASR